MDGKNSFGRRVSLLNEHVEVPSSYRYPSYSNSTHSRTSSYASTPCISPSTPPLVRSDSTDSGAMQTPSPITPNFTFEGLSTAQQVSSPVFSTSPSFFPHKDHIYPPLQNDGSHLPYMTNGSSGAPQQPFYRPNSEEHQPMPPANPKTKKNQYPCPMANQFSCPDYFTTSGHAARHAKKHTGKKDAFCPECNKAFTRKDNMEQHRRTHQNGRNSARNGEATQAKKAKQQAKRSKPTTLQVATDRVDPRLPTSPTSSIGLAPAVQPIDSFNSAFVQQPSFSDPYTYPFSGAGSRYDLMSPSYAVSGLETLAIAASATGEKRKFDG